MIEFLYGVLEKIGYVHPIHPPLTHIPMGLVFGAFVFALIALLFRRTILPLLAYNRIILLALVIHPLLFHLKKYFVKLPPLFL